MSFLGIYRAIYAYAPQSDQELSLSEGDLLYVLEKSTDDDWWKAKRKASATEDDEPVGLIPNNYVEEAIPVGKYRALYDYQRQTEEELSFSEDAILDAYDNTDPDWILVGQKKEYGFAPANYLEPASGAPTPAASSPTESAPPPLPTRTPVAQVEEDDYDEPASPVRPSAAAAVAAALQAQMQAKAQAEPVSPPPISSYSPPPAPVTAPSTSTTTHTRKGVHFTPEASDDDEPSPPPRLPARPMSDASSTYTSPISPRPATTFDEIPGAGLARFPVDEIVNKKKVPCILELGAGKITLIPQKRGSPATSWDIQDMQTYSADGKHVGLDLVSPMRSLDLRAESKDLASEIIRSLGEMRGAVRAVGLREVAAAATSGGKKFGIILYDFDAQGSDEVSVRVGDEVAILDDSQSEEWWNVRRMKDSKEGVVPSSYIELKVGGSSSAFDPPTPTVSTSSASSKSKSREYGHQHTDSVGPGINLPKRGSSLATASQPPQQSSRSRTSSKQASGPKPKPNSHRVRVWTDRSGTFKVEAEFLNVRDGVIHLHKVNGVKIAVPIAKMSKYDLEYIENDTGQSLDEDKPLSDLRGRKQGGVKTVISGGTNKPTSGITIDRAPQNGQKNGYDWFEFFLGTGVDPHACQRYANNFDKDNMDEAILPDITPSVLRTLGLKEGDILRVMKFLDAKYGRKKDSEVADGSRETLFTNADGSLKNNTRRERPAPGVQTSDVVDSKFLEQRRDSPAPKETKEDPWAPKPSKQETSEVPKATSPAPQQVAAAPAEAQAQPKPQLPPTGALRELSLLDEPLRPTVVTPPVEKPVASPVPPAAPASAPPQQTWQPPPPNILAAPLSVFQQPQATDPTSPQYLNYQATGMLQPQHTAVPLQYQQTAALQPQATARQRPTAPQIQSASALVPPPPQRPQSAPGQNMQIQPLMPALTGYQSVTPGGQLSMAAIQQQQQQQQQQQILQQQQQILLQQQALHQQQQAAALQPQMTAMPNNFGVPQLNYPGLTMQPTGFAGGTPGLMPQPTGSGLGPLPPPFKPTVDLSMPTPLMSQNTAVPASNGFGGTPGIPGGFGAGTPGGLGRGLMPALQPLKPQATGPAPQIKFGTTPGRSPLVPQPTGARKANLNAATAENPFGF